VGKAVSEAKIEIFSDIACLLGEGPTYDPLSKTLHWFDILGRKLLARTDAGAVTVTDLPELTSALGIIDAGRQLLVTETGLHVRDTATGRITLHTPIEADNPATRSNDSRVHPCGAFWIGTMGKHAEKKAGAIYWFFRGEIRKIVPDVTIPNSICFSPDGATACRRAADFLRPARRQGCAGRLGSRFGGRAVERALGRRRGRCLFARRQAHPHHRPASAADLVPGLLRT
jgi:sugar lactone lactonase YvrE